MENTISLESERPTKTSAIGTISNGVIPVKKLDFNLIDTGCSLIINDNEELTHSLLLKLVEQKKYDKIYFLSDTVCNYVTNYELIFDWSKHKVCNYLDKIFEMDKDVKKLVILKYETIDYGMNTIKNMFFNSRHFGIDFIIVHKICHSISPDLRINFDNIFIGSLCHIDGLNKRLYEYYGGSLSNFNKFTQLLNQLNNSTSFTSFIKNKIFWVEKNKEVNTNNIQCDRLNIASDDTDILNKIYEIEDYVSKINKLCSELKQSVK
jgi:hypothetical protein